MVNKNSESSSKKEIKSGIQLALTWYGLVCGFSNTYLRILFAVGFAKEVWVVFLALILGVVSSLGLIEWISRN